MEINQLVLYHLYYIYFIFYLGLLKGSNAVMTGRKSLCIVAIYEYLYKDSCNTIIVVMYTVIVARWKLENLVIFTGFISCFCYVFVSF